MRRPLLLLSTGSWSSRRRVVCRYAVVTSFYFLSAVVFLKLGVAVISSSSSTLTQDRMLFYGRLPVSSSSADQDRPDAGRLSMTADDIDVAISTSGSNESSSTVRRATVPLQPTQQLNGSGSSEPLVVHVTWFYGPNTEFRFHEAISLLAVQRFVRPRKILFWYDAASTLPTGPWWQFARQSVAHLLPVPVVRPTSIFNRTVEVPEHQSDVVRLAVLDNHGGLYVDLDLIIVRPIDDLLRRLNVDTGSGSIATSGPSTTATASPGTTAAVAMGAETPDMLGSGFILAPRPNADFIRLWRRAYADGFVDSDWNRHSVYVPMELARLHPRLVHVEWFSINRPNWFERDWLYGVGRLWDWSGNYAVHLWYRDRPRDDVDYDPVTIRTLNTTVGEVFRHIYYGHSQLLPPHTTESYN